MKIRKSFLLLFTLSFAILLQSCSGNKKDEKKNESSKKEKQEKSDDFQYKVEKFADIKILRYKIPDFDKLDLQQKKLTYYLYKAGLSGRDIIYDQNYKHNLEIRKALENIIKNYEGDKKKEKWNNFIVYAKRVFFSNGIHHHYSMSKLEPNFSKDYFKTLLKKTNTKLKPKALKVIFNDKDAKRVEKNPKKDIVKASATNFYGDNVTKKEVEEFYKDKGDSKLSHGINTKLVKGKDGELKEKVWKKNGMYSPAIKEIIKWLKKAASVAENKNQKKTIELLIDYYKTGDLKTWDKFNVQWVKTKDTDIDFINGFIEVYGDPMGIKASYESVVQVKDFEASKRLKVLSENAQWFENNSTFMDKHKKDNVVGVSYNVVNVAGEAGDASPSTPIGINLPNARWIREKHGSKSVSLGNITSAYDKGGSQGIKEEFCYNEERLNRTENYGTKADKLHTALHEVIGHASGKIEEGVGKPSETLQNYSSTLEEARADLVGLYFLMDNKLKKLGLLDTMAYGKASYDSYIRNGLLLQLRRIEAGHDIEEDHMRNRQLVAKWVYEKGKEDNVIEKKVKNDKTYFIINDYQKLRELFGKLLREVQRIISEGDYEAGKKLVENYGVEVNEKLHKEVLKRTEKLDIAPYGGFINPVLKPVKDDKGKIKDIKVEYPKDFLQQMLNYGEKYSYL
ncbi:MAG: dihydrofolate reductase [Flavobacteriales bacterium]